MLPPAAATEAIAPALKSRDKLQHTPTSAGMLTEGKGRRFDGGHTLGARMMPPLLFTKLLVITAFTGATAVQPSEC